MKTQLSVIFSVLSACCFLSTQTIAADALTTRAISRSFTPAYATLVQAEASPFLSTKELTVPFDQIRTTREITLDTTTDTFTLPRGIYSIDFQIALELQTGEYPSPGPVEDAIEITDVYLDLNNGSSIVPLDWGVSFAGLYENSDGGNRYSWTVLSGSKLFFVGSDNTVVKCIVVRQGTAHDIRFGADGPSFSAEGFSPTFAREPVHVSLHKIDGCDE